MSWKDARQRRDEVRAAFLEGFRLGAGPDSIRDAAEEWAASAARKLLGEPLEAPPPIPPTIPAKAAPGRPIGAAAAQAIAEAGNSH